MGTQPEPIVVLDNANVPPEFPILTKPINVPEKFIPIGAQTEDAVRQEVLEEAVTQGVLLLLLLFLLLML